MSSEVCECCDKCKFVSGLMIEVKLSEKLSIWLRHLKVLDRSGKLENSDCDIVHWPPSLGHLFQQ